MNQSKYYIQQAKEFLLLAISFFIPFYKKIVPLLIILWFLLTLFELSFENFKQSRHKPLFYSITGYFILLVISLLWTKNMNSGFKELETNLSLLVFPIAFAFSLSLSLKKQINTIKAFILGNITAVITQLAIATFRFLTQKDELIQKISFFFTYVEFSYFTHPSYASMFSLFSIISILYLIYVHKKSKKWLFLILILFPSIYLYASKAGFLAAFISTLVLILFYIIKYKKIIPSIIASILFIILGLFLYKSPRVQHLLTEKKLNISKSENNEKTDARILIWQLNIELIQKNLISGTGVGDYKDEILKIYKREHYEEAIKQIFDPHNQFLKSFAIAGIFGFANMLLIFIIVFYNSIRERNLYTFLFAMIQFINFLFESMLSRQSGIIFFSFFVSAFFFLSNNKNYQNLKQTAIIK